MLLRQLAESGKIPPNPQNPLYKKRPRFELFKHGQRRPYHRLPEEKDHPLPASHNFGHKDSVTSYRKLYGLRSQSSWCNAGLIISGYSSGFIFLLVWPRIITSALQCHPGHSFHQRPLNNGREDQGVWLGVAMLLVPCPELLQPLPFECMLPTSSPSTRPLPDDGFLLFDPQTE